ncbi:MAG: tol-pal system protein YbgF, partial [Bilophila sp.]
MKKNSMKSAFFLAPMLMGTLALTGCVNQNQVDSMQARLAQQEQQLQMMNSQLSGVQPAQADTWAQVQSLRQEMGAVRGQIDDFNNATASAGGLPGLAQRVNTHHAALQTIATQFDMNLNLDGAAPADPGAPAVPGAPGTEGQQPGMPQGMPQTGQAGQFAGQAAAPVHQQQPPAQQPAASQKDT